VILVINGHNLNVEQFGPENGPGVVLLHHGLGSIKAWREQIPALADAGYHVIAYDRWGYGGSDARQGLDLPTFAADVSDQHKLLEQLGVHQTALVGHSDGGTIALYYAAKYPDQVTCLVSVAAHIYVEPKMEPGILGIQRAFESDEHFRTGLRYAHGAKYESVFHNWFDGWHRIESLSWDMRPMLGQLRCPALVVQGAEDEHATTQHAKDITNAIPGAEMWLIPNAGHMVPQEASNIFNPRLLQFLRQPESIGQWQDR
jgi:pimeloyl-ACP methyl ester carboxylesterase